jgi:uncharacterized protein (DUF2336 family)
MTLSLAQLRMLARLPGSDHELPRALAQALCEPAAGRLPEDRTLLDVIVDELIEKLPLPARQEIADHLADRPDAPYRAVMRLAGDAGAVASLLLARSPVLSDDDLAALAQGKSEAHRLAIARRPHLSEHITDILIRGGEAAVLDTIAGNPGARFSAFGANALIDKARAHEPLWQRLAGRSDLPAEPDEDLTALPARPLEELAELLADRKLALCEAVIELADADRVADLATLVCGRIGGDPHNFLHHLFAADETTLMVVCRAAQLDLESFSAVMRLRHRRHPLRGGDVGRLLRAFQAMTDLPARPPAIAAAAAAD